MTQVSFSAVKCQFAYLDEGGVHREISMDPQIKTIQLYREGWPQSYPVVRLDESLPLILEFDDLSGDARSLSYRLIHCNADWTPSDLPEMEALEGYPENDFFGGEPSFNTYTSYIHYHLKLPNEEVRWKVSGNYLLVVYLDRDPENVAFTRRFMVTEGKVNVNARAGIPVLQEFQGCCQEVNFTVQHPGMTIDDPFSGTRVMICQNGLWDMAIGPLSPFMVNPGELVYESHEENVFPGGNEYRFFDTKNTRTPTYYVQNIEFIHPWYHFELKTDRPNPPHIYSSGEDINGRYHIASDDGRNPALDADYTFVHFSLESPFPMDGEVYIAGALTNWQFSEMNRMEYNAQKGMYIKSLLLKQGVYNYRYLFLPAGSERFDIGAIEGNHFETENEYLILFYYRPPGDRYDRLLGHQVVHSQ